METLPKLTPTPAFLVRATARRADGRVVPPDTLCGAGVKAKNVLPQCGWIEPTPSGHLLADARATQPSVCNGLTHRMMTSRGRHRRPLFAGRHTGEAGHQARHAG